MLVCRVTLELRSALATPLSAETLWGHIAWGIRYRAGEQALCDWLARYDTGPAPLALSDPFPEGFWPRPVLPPAPRPAEPPAPSAAREHKASTRRQWISHQRWQDAAGNVNAESIAEAAARSEQPPSPHSQLVHHAGINRLTGGTAQPGGGTLYSVEQSYYAGPVRFDVWVRSPESPEVVRQWFDDGLSGGYGRDAGTGMGRLAIAQPGVVGARMPEPARPNAAVLLNAAVPAPGDPHIGFFAFSARAGRVGGEFATGSLPDGSTVRSKYPVFVLLRGTLLVDQRGVPPTFGRVIDGVHPGFRAIRHYGLALTLACRVDERVTRQAHSGMPCSDSRVAAEGLS